MRGERGLELADLHVIEQHAFHAGQFAHALRERRALRRVRML
jgi:hypothetical protein